MLVFAALLPIVNPLGAAPRVPGHDARSDDATRAVLARKVTVNWFMLLMAAVFIGTYVLDFFGLSVPVVQSRGGLVVCARRPGTCCAAPMSRRNPTRDGVHDPEARRHRGVLSADAAAHRRTRLDLGGHHHRRQPPADRRARSSRRRCRRCWASSDLPRPSTSAIATRSGWRIRWAAPAPPSWCGCRRSSCCASACRSCGTASTRWSGLTGPAHVPRPVRPPLDPRRHHGSIWQPPRGRL